MSFFVRAAIASILIFMISSSSHAQIVKRGTSEEAIALVKKVKRMWVTSGPAKTIQAVNKLTHNLRQKDLYPIICHVDGYVVGHYVQALRGANMMDIPGANGKKILRSFVDLIEEKGKGWVDYAWMNPIRRKLENKSTYLEAINKEYFVGVGIFKRIDESRILE